MPSVLARLNKNDTCFWEKLPKFKGIISNYSLSKIKWKLGIKYL